MIRAIHEGKLKCMYIKGEDTITSDANANDVDKALSPCSISSSCRTSTSPRPPALPTSFCPPRLRSKRKEPSPAPSAASSASIASSRPLGYSKPDWEIIQDIANRLGAGWNYTHPSQIMDECATLTPIFAGVSYDRLEGYKSLQWPVEKDGKDSPLLFTEKFPFPDGKAKFHPIEWIEPCEEKSPEFNHHLNNGRLLEHFEQGAMTYRSKGIREITPTNFVEVSPELAAQQGTLEAAAWSGSAASTEKRPYRSS